jgi:hypothetical protein
MFFAKYGLTIDKIIKNIFLEIELRNSIIYKKSMYYTLIYNVINLINTLLYFIVRAISLQ